MRKKIKIFLTFIAGFLITIYSLSFFTTRHRSNKAIGESQNNTPTFRNLETVIPKPQNQPVFYMSVGGSHLDTDLPSKPNSKSMRYTIEIAKLKSQTEAENLLISLKAKKIDAFYTPTRRGSEVIYHIRIGLFSNPTDAEIKLNKISSAIKVHAEVTKLQ